MGSRYPRLPRSPSMRQDRGGRDGLDSFIDRYPGLDIYFDDLAIDPRVRRMMYSRLPDGFDIDPRSFDRHRSSNGRRILERSYRLRRDITHEDNGTDDGLAMAPHGNPPLPFGRAMKDLHRQLVKAEELYSRFQSEFDNDTATVKKYASAKALSDMWASKVEGIRDPQTFVEREDRMADEGLEKFEEKFAEMEKKVAAALQVAASSTLSSGPPSERHQASEKHQARVEASKRLQQRAHLALQHFLNLMEKAKERREDCRHLVNELQQFQGLVNPDTEMNKELFKSSYEDEDVGADVQPAGATVWDD